ncbi:fimbria/pilus periplasmic chaperone [Erwinia tracheiphila]|uniref:Pilus assembly protein PapD n=1 Tax=Erwinia tracheiphila TaxID=65700 RepID=A0A0M2KKE9_9GAMM|nr:fimbria/pilus periplasmic chaperone [Erwinia tracheiphila]EOS95793.1 chaperone protein [Erwinia tracheiphila PSU-1]KKF37476.1 pilus assembly protein PapD [Erwinia tracheiphila]UIA88880.1 fimbria/pilus periplasmic chaperone [Erwinia tracheiphila]UIA97261.1 fimbria/pilus periplasmic chaperone [Erwinia tracheiphila]
MKKLFSSYLSLTILTLLFSPVLSASIVVNGTRVIYPSSAREISVKMTNMGKRPLLIQSWIDDGDMTAKPENIRVPFVLSPPFNRVDAGKGQTLRISQTDPDLPEDRESVFWLNILEIPAKNPTMEEKNSLQMAFRTRIKFFYRPEKLAGDPSDSIKMLKWQQRGTQLVASNPTPYFVSLANLMVNDQKVEGEMVAPFQSQSFHINGQAGDKITGEFINDFGALISFQSRLQE